VPIETVPVDKLPREIVRQIEERMLAPRPMVQKVSGVVASVSGETYARHASGALVRIVVTDGEVQRVIPWSKAKRKAMKRNRLQER
jgi:hypothetical protein